MYTGLKESSSKVGKIQILDIDQFQFWLFRKLPFLQDQVSLHKKQLCLILQTVPKYFGLVQIFLSRTKNWITYQSQTHWARPNCFEQYYINAIQFLVRLKKYGLAKNIFRPVQELLFCFQNCSDQLREKISRVREKLLKFKA